MTTKAAATVQPAPAESLERLAYGSVEGIPVDEPHERDRLGYYIFLWAQNRKDPLEMVLRSAAIRMKISETEALERIQKYLAEHGVRL
jgi:hypothetical protein